MNLDKQIFQAKESSFQKIALDVFRYQYENVAVYQNYIDSLGISPKQVTSLPQIPFLPIEFFKTHKVLAKTQSAALVFESSGTTGILSSKHYVAQTEIYEESLLRGFTQAFESPNKYCYVALLPNYLERQNSSLVHMVNRLMQESKNPGNGFYLYNHKDLYRKLHELEAAAQPTLLFGVSFALLDFAAQYKLDLQYTQIIETGGMKGRRKEITRDELHRQLCTAFNTPEVYSEYGMTELLSQAYAKKKEEYHCPPWMRVLIREVNDPFTNASQGSSGGINIIDLANLYSCSFIETKDLGRINPNGSFSVLGRFDTSDIRGCNLLVE